MVIKRGDWEIKVYDESIIPKVLKMLNSPISAISTESAINPKSTKSADKVETSEEPTEQKIVSKSAKTLPVFQYSPYCPICSLNYSSVVPLYSEKPSGVWVHRLYVKCDKCNGEFLLKLQNPWSLEEFKEQFERQTGKKVLEGRPWEEFKQLLGQESDTE